MPLDDRLADPKWAFHIEYRLIPLRPDLHAVVFALGRDLVFRGLVAGHGEATRTHEENQDNNAVFVGPSVRAISFF